MILSLKTPPPFFPSPRTVAKFGKCLIVALAQCFAVIPAMGAASRPFVHPLFSSNMVLQRDVQNPVWGWTTPGAVVSVAIHSVTYQATAGSDGRWQALVGPFAAGGPYTMTVSGPQSQTITNIMMGDVYLCSGQSNMYRGLRLTEAGVNKNVVNYPAEVADSLNYTAKVRVFTVPLLAAASPQQVPGGGSWLVPSTTNTPDFSATAYFTAREINKQQNVPIGVIVSSLGGSDIKAWSEPGFISAFPDTAQTAYDQTGLGVATTSSSLSALYNGMLVPLAPFRIKGALWYQGEANKTAPEQYGRLLPAFMSAVRTLFADQNLPFLVVQLPNIDSSGWAGVRESQFQTVLNDPHSAIVTTIDLGETSNIHPMDKQDVGLRTANAAAKLVYGQTAAPTNAIGPGPVFDHAVISGSTVRCYFQNVGGGLMVGQKPTVTWNNATVPDPTKAIQEQTGVPLKGFALCGANGTYFAADATIDNADNTIVLSSASVPTPVSVRYLWDNNPTCNLYRKVVDSSGKVVDGMPVAPFRTDPTYKLVVNSGLGSGNYSLNAMVGITANSTTGLVFDHWSGDTGFLSATDSPTVTATVGQRYVTVLANYRVVAAPTGLTASPEVGRVTLTWTAMNAVHYNLKRSTSVGGPFTTIAENLASATKYVDSTVGSGTTYHYVISAVNPQGEGPDSSPVSATLVPVVNDVTVTDSTGKVALTWSPFDGTVDSYNIKRASSADGPFATIATVSGTTTGYTDQTVLAGDAFYYVVTAVNSGGETVNSLSVHAVPSFLPPPLQNVDVGTVGFGGGAYASTSGNYTVVGSGTDIGGTADSLHFLYARLSGNGSITARIVSPGSGVSKVGVMMRASLDAGAASAAVLSNPSSAKCELRTTTGGATNVANSNTGVNASTYPWVRVVRTGNTFSGYVSADGTTWISLYFNPPAISMTDPIFVGLAVSACDNTTTTTAVFDNVVVTGLSLQEPPAPSGLSVTQRPGAGQATLHWNSSAAAAAYNIRRATTSGGPYTTVASGLNALGYECTDLSPGSTFYYCVTAADSAGESPNSNEVVVDLTPPDITVPADISICATGASGAVVTFSTAALDNINGILETTNNPASGSVFPIGTTTVTTSAKDALENISSRTFSVTVDVPPPSNFAGAALSESQIRLTWTDNAPFGTGYVLQRSPHALNLWTTLGGSLSAGSTNYTDSLLDVSVSYDYRLKRLVSEFASTYAVVNASTPAGVGDGIPGSWRFQYFGDGLSAAGDAAANADPDGDGQINQKEYLAGTNPVDGTSVLRAFIGQSENNILLSFMTVFEKTYRLEQSTQLGAGAVWQALQQHIPGTGGTVTVNLTNDGSQPRRFFRIVVE